MLVSFCGIFPVCKGRSVFEVLTGICLHFTSTSVTQLTSHADGFFLIAGFRGDFRQQAEECGLSEPWVTSLKAKLSFAITSPGTVATDDQVTRFLNNMRCGHHSRFCCFQSSPLREPNPYDPSERDARLTRQRDQLRGLDITGPLEPAHGLYDLCAQTVERNEVAYISPSKCLSRQQELTGAKPEKELQLDASKTGLVIKEQPMTQEISLTSGLALYQAMQRRALAMDLTNLATYEVMKRWTDRMFAIFAQPAAPGFQKVSQAQLLRADRQAFIRLSETLNGSLKVMPMVGKPLDPMIQKLESDVSVRSGRIQQMQRSLNQISFKKDRKAKAKEKTRSGSPCHQVLRECTPGHPKGIRFVTVTILAHASKDRHAHASMFVLCLGATKIIPKRSINDSVLKVFHLTQQQNGRSNMWIMNVQRTQRT